MALTQLELSAHLLPAHAYGHGQRRPQREPFLLTNSRFSCRAFQFADMTDAAVPDKPKSALLDGQSVLRRALDSVFGEFHTAYAKVKDNSDDFSLPRVIVIGEKNQGKSSLLENITKCAIFPRNTSQCTKMPIRLRMRQIDDPKKCKYSVTYKGELQKAETSQDILPLITKIMDSTDELSDEEVIVEITQVATPPFEFIDLPGLDLSPKHRSEEIMWKYINEQAPTTVILWVIEGTSGALNGSAALEKLYQAKQLPNTILVLTKADKVMRDEDDLKLVFSRLLGKWQGHEYLNQLVGCVAVANRKHSDTVSLVQHDDVEAQLFADMLRAAENNVQPEFTPDELKCLKANMSSKQLILKLEAEYNKRIVRDWIPLVRTRAVQWLAHASNNLVQLGEPPETIVMKDLLSNLQDKVSFEQICSDVAAQAKNQLQGTALSFLPDLPATRRDQDFDNIASWAEAVVEFEEHFKQSVDAVMQPGLYIEAAFKAYKSVFEQDPKLSRFPELQQQLSTGAIPHQMKEALMFAKPDVDSMVKTALQQIYNVALPTADLQHVFSALKDSIGYCIVKHVFQCLKKTALFVPRSFQLEEVERARQLRIQYNQDIKKYQDAGESFNNIERRLQHCVQATGVGRAEVTANHLHAPAAE